MKPEIKKKVPEDSCGSLWNNQFKLEKNGAILSEGACEKASGDQQQRKSMPALFYASEKPKENPRLREKGKPCETGTDFEQLNRRRKEIQGELYVTQTLTSK